MRKRNSSDAASIGKLYIVLAVAIIVIFLLTVCLIRARNTSTNVFIEPGNIAETKKTVSSETIRDGLNDMGKMVTQEYFFTEVTTFSKEKVANVFSWEFTWFGTKSSFIVSYDGSVYAGVDFAGIEIEKYDADKIITVKMPDAEIISFELDEDSYQVLDEKNGIFNRLTIEDSHEAVQMTKDSALTKAVNRGILEKASENAKALIKNFIISMIGTDYKILFE